MTSQQIPNYPNYSVDTDGNVFGLRGKLKTELVGKRIKYERVTLYLDGLPIRKLVHHIVLETFVGPRLEHCEARHIDGNSRNNKLENLAWGTKLENWDDRRRHGRDLNGTNHPNSKHTEAQVIEMRRRYDNGDSIMNIANALGLSWASVNLIVKRKAWTHV